MSGRVGASLATPENNRGLSEFSRRAAPARTRPVYLQSRSLQALSYRLRWGCYWWSVAPRWLRRVPLPELPSCAAATHDLRRPYQEYRDTGPPSDRWEFLATCLP